VDSELDRTGTIHIYISPALLAPSGSVHTVYGLMVIEYSYTPGKGQSAPRSFGRDGRAYTNY